MKEIKFRTMTHEKIWRYASGSMELYYFFYGLDDGALNENTLGQFTGLKDTNGKEIYEGDIVQSKKLPQMGEVCFRNTAFRVHGYILCELDDVAIIGNIMENPKLLKEERND